MSETHEMLISRLATALSALHHIDAGPARLCEAGRHMLNAEGAALSLITSADTATVVASTDELARQLEDLQEVVGEGPSRDAVRTKTVQVADVASHGERWSLMHEHGQRLEFRGALIAVPLRPHYRVIGTLLAYHRNEKSFATDSVVAEFLGAALGAALLDDSRPAEQDGEFADVWSAQAQVHQATGMIIAQIGVRAEDALALLRGQAFVRGTNMLHVAQQIVDRNINFRHFTIDGD